MDSTSYVTLRKWNQGKHHTESSNMSFKILKRHVNQLENLFLGPTDVIDILGLSYSHPIGKGATRNPKSLSEAYLPATRDQNC